MTLALQRGRQCPSNSVYCGVRDPLYGIQVTAEGQTLDPAPSQRVHNHSPDGFEWGYNGSGPAQLALALLLHATRGNTECAVDLYQRYKSQVVAGWAKVGWVTTRAHILRWIGEQPGHVEGRESAAEGGAV